MTQRIHDMNGFFEIKKNPISKVGVFPYLGKSIDPKLEPDKIYYVYRPKEELASDECRNSFKLLPFVDDHTMLGKEADGLTPAEKKGVHGVLGEDIMFEEDTLFANMKVFSDSITKKIDYDGKVELSCGYRCKYDEEEGVFQGKPYQFVQRNIRGNHIALVAEGRMGRDVAVLDHNKLTFTLDSKELQMAEEQEKKEGQDDTGAVTLESLAAKVDELAKIVLELKSGNGDQQTQLDEAAEAEKKKAEDEEMEKKKEDKEKAAEDAAEIKTLKKEVNDLKQNGVKTLMGEIARRDNLANQLKPFIGSFDHSEKTLDEVAKYGVTKLGIKCEDGKEASTLAGYLHGRSAPTKPHIATGQDNAEGSELDNYISGQK